MSKKNERVYGIHAVKRIVDKSPESVVNAWVQQNLESGSAKKIYVRLNQLNIPVQTVNRVTLDKMTKEQNHQGVMIEVRSLSRNITQDLDEIIRRTSDSNPLFLVLDSIQDPRNLGACIRTAVAAGVSAVILPKDRSASINETVRKVASGAVDDMTIVTVVNLVRAIKKLKDRGVWVVGTTSESDLSIYELDLISPIAIVVGGEEKGLRSSVRKECDHLASIPIAGKIESLNVSVATGIFLYEVLRQRKKEI